MTFKAFDAQKKKLDEWTVFSVGGGALAEEGHDRTATNDIYNMNTMSQILYWCEHTGRSYWEYVEQCEGPEIWDFLAEVGDHESRHPSRTGCRRGIARPLNLRRKASAYSLARKAIKTLFAHADWYSHTHLAVSEEKCFRGKIVTAPTCGAWQEWFQLSCITCRKAATSATHGLAGISDCRTGGKHRQAQCFHLRELKLDARPKWE